MITNLITSHTCFDILDLILLSSVIFNLGRLYQLLKNSNQSKH